MTGIENNVERAKVRLNLDDSLADGISAAWFGLRDYIKNPEFDQRYWKLLDVPCKMAAMDLNSVGEIPEKCGDVSIVYISMTKYGFNGSEPISQMYFVKDCNWMTIHGFERDDDGVTLTLDVRKGCPMFQEVA